MFVLCFPVMPQRYEKGMELNNYATIILLVNNCGIDICDIKNAIRQAP